MELRQEIKYLHDECKNKSFRINKNGLEILDSWLVLKLRVRIPFCSIELSEKVSYTKYDFEGLA